MPATTAKVLFIATDGFEQAELFRPRQALLEAGLVERNTHPDDGPPVSGSASRARLLSVGDLTLSTTADYSTS